MQVLRRGSKEYEEAMRRVEMFAATGCEELWLSWNGVKIVGDEEKK